jgi:RNA polymerase sigma-70 factor, ECF subfamily
LNHVAQASPAASVDAELIARAQRGEEQAFEAIYNAHKRKVYYLCLRMIGNTAEAEELMQEAFMQVFRKIQTFRGDSSFSTWLHRVSVNVVLMKLRKKTPNEVPIDGEDENQEFELPPKEFGAPDLTLAGLVDRVTLDRAVAKLPKGCRQVFLLHDVMGCEHNEIAAMLGYTVGNSKSQLHKARMRLRKLLRMGGRKNGHSGNGASAAEFAQGLANPSGACDGCPS